MEREQAIEISRNARNILIVKTNLLGDTLNFLPVANFFRKFASSARISWLVSRPGYPVVSELADVDEILLLEDGFLYDYGNLLRTSAWLRKKKFDLLVTSFQEECFLINLLALMSRAPVRVGYNLRNRGWFFNIVVPKGEAERRVELNAQIIKTFGGGEIGDYLYVPRADAAGAKQFAARLAGLGVKENGLCVLHLFSPKPTRSWRIEHADELIKRLQSESGLTPVLIGSEAEVGKWGEQKKPLGLINLAGKLSILELFYLLKQARLFIGIDSFPLQLTEFASTKAIALFGSTEISKALVPAATVVKAEVECAPCWPEKQVCDRDFICWRKLTPDLILGEAKKLLG